MASPSDPTLDLPPNKNNAKDGVNEAHLDDNVSSSQIQRRREFTSKQNFRRKIYHEITSFKTFPLQELAINDLEENLKDYFPTNENASVVSKSNAILAKSVTQSHTHNACDADASTKVDNESTHSSDSVGYESLRKIFLDEFLRENLIPVSAKGQSQIDHASENTDGDQADSLDEKENIQLNEEQKNVQNAKPQQCDTGNSTKINEQKKDDIRNNNLEEFLPTLWSMEPRIFAMETAMKGKRKYVSCHLGRFMDHYWRECNVHNRHYYELIREDSPCRLYFGAYCYLCTMCEGIIGVDSHTLLLLSCGINII